MANRFWYQNACFLSRTLMIASSEQQNSPISHAQDQQRQKTWRSQVGWTITNDNNKIDIFRSPSTVVLTLTNGTYATGALLAAEIQTKLVAAIGAVSWEVTYNTTTFKFRIRDSGGAPSNFSLLWNTGANKTNSAGKDIGFDTSADDTGASDYTADFGVYQSRQFIRIYASVSVNITANVFAMVGMNFGQLATATYVLEANATDVWTAPSFSTSGTVTNDPYVTFFASQDFRYWRLTINNTTDSSGFSEIGVLCLDAYVTPTVCISQSKSNQPQEATDVVLGITLQHFPVYRPRRDVWQMEWTELAAADASLVDQLFDGIAGFSHGSYFGENWFFCFDSSAPNNTGMTIYGHHEGFTKQFVGGGYWTYSFTFYESL